MNTGSSERLIGKELAKAHCFGRVMNERRYGFPWQHMFLGGILRIQGLIYLSFLLAARVNLPVRRTGFFRRSTVASHGLVPVIARLVLVGLSLCGYAESEETENGPQTPEQEAVLRTWVANAAALKNVPPLPYNRLLDRIVGPEAVRRLVFDYRKVDHDTTLAQLATSEYGRSEYWPLLAAINRDRGYYDFKTAAANTLLKADSFMEVWRVSRYYGTDRSTRLKIAEPDVAAAYDELLKLANERATLDISGLQDKYKRRELNLEWGPAQLKDARNLRELALAYYGAVKYWKLFAWVNPDKLAQATEDTPVSADQDLQVLHIVVP